MSAFGVELMTVPLRNSYYSEKSDILKTSKSLKSSSLGQFFRSSNLPRYH